MYTARVPKMYDISWISSYVRTFTIVYLVVGSGLTNMCEPDVDIIRTFVDDLWPAGSSHGLTQPR